LISALLLLATGPGFSRTFPVVKRVDKNGRFINMGWQVFSAVFQLIAGLSTFSQHLLLYTTNNLFIRGDSA